MNWVRRGVRKARGDSKSEMHSISFVQPRSPEGNVIRWRVFIPFFARKPLMTRKSQRMRTPRVAAFAGAAIDSIVLLPAPDFREDVQLDRRLRGERTLVRVQRVEDVRRIRLRCCAQRPGRLTRIVLSVDQGLFLHAILSGLRGPSVLPARGCGMHRKASFRT